MCVCIREKLSNSDEVFINLRLSILSTRPFPICLVIAISLLTFNSSFNPAIALQEELKKELS